MSTTLDERTLECDVAVIGGSLGGVAAALAAAEAGKRAVLSEATIGSAAKSQAKGSRLWTSIVVRTTL